MLIPVSFVSDEDREVAAGKQYPRPEPPRPPLPPAPAGHRAYWSRPEYRERVAAGGES